MDMLIPLYAPPADTSKSVPPNVQLRKPLAPEHDLVIEWIADRFTPGWASEARAALGNRPPTVHVAIRGDAILGFCCADAIALGFVGPIGVADEARGQGVGAALLRASLADMYARGYRYAIAGAVGAQQFFARVAGAKPIESSSPGLYRGMLQHPNRG